MIAKAWCFKEKGEPANLVLKEVELSELGDDELLIENKKHQASPIKRSLQTELTVL